MNNSRKKHRPLAQVLSELLNHPDLPDRLHNIITENYLNDIYNNMGRERVAAFEQTSSYLNFLLSAQDVLSAEIIMEEQDAS